MVLIGSGILIATPARYCFSPTTAVACVHPVVLELTPLTASNSVTYAHRIYACTTGGESQSLSTRVTACLTSLVGPSWGARKAIWLRSHTARRTSAPPELHKNNETRSHCRRQ
jgi:hypothetical protein